MTVSISSVPRRLHEGSRSALESTSYPHLVEIAEKMAQQDARIVFDSLRPMGDELWNFIDGNRTVRDVAEAVCLEFDFDLDPALFIPLMEGMVRAGIIEIGN